MPAADWLRARARATPERTGLIVDGAVWTYGELDRLVDGWTGRLHSHPLQPGDRLGILLANRLEYVLLVHAAARAGAVLVPLNVRLTPPELRWQLAHAGCRLLICERSTADRAAAAAGDAPLLNVDDAGPIRVAETEAPAAAQSWNLTRDQGIIFTSGTTGRPKGVVLTFGNHFWSAVASATCLGLNVDDRWLSCLPLYHVGGLAVLFRSVLYGTAVDLYPRFDLARISAALDRDPITLISLVPTMVHRLLEARGERPWSPALRHVLVGGAALPAALAARCRAAGVPISATYGLSEAASQVATLPAGRRGEAKPGSVGRPLLFTEVEIRDDADRPVRPGTRGEVVVRGPTVMRGYHDDPAATARTLRGGWLHTGDVGYLDEDGALRLVQRRSDVIVTGGENVYPAEVEQALGDHPEVEAICVVGIPDPEWGQRVTAMVVARDGGQLDVDDLLAFGRKRLAGYKLPRAVRVVKALPLTASGKIARRAVAEALAR